MLSCCVVVIVCVCVPFPPSTFLRLQSDTCLLESKPNWLPKGLRLSRHAYNCAVKPYSGLYCKYYIPPHPCGWDQLVKCGFNSINKLRECIRSMVEVMLLLRGEENELLRVSILFHFILISFSMSMELIHPCVTGRKCIYSIYLLYTIFRRVAFRIWIPCPNISGCCNNMHHIYIFNMVRYVFWGEE